MTFFPAILSTSEIVSRSASFTFAGIAGIDRGADGAERPPQPGPVLPVRLALHEVLTVRLNSGIVASHKLLILA